MRWNLWRMFWMRCWAEKHDKNKTKQNKKGEKSVLHGIQKNGILKYKPISRQSRQRKVEKGMRIDGSD